MPFEKVTPEKLSTAVTRQIEKLILRGILRPGERLPADRELAEKLGVSRPSLREAVADLQDKGLLTARAGAGIYVADVLGSAFSPALIRLRTTRGALLDQHRRINAAIQARDSKGAREAVDAHLAYVEKALSDQQKADQNEAIARQRFEHEQSR